MLGITVLYYFLGGMININAITLTLYITKCLIVDRRDIELVSYYPRQIQHQE